MHRLRGVFECLPEGGDCRRKMKSEVGMRKWEIKEVGKKEVGSRNAEVGNPEAGSWHSAHGNGIRHSVFGFR